MSKSRFKECPLFFPKRMVDGDWLRLLESRILPSAKHYTEAFIDCAGREISAMANSQFTQCVYLDWRLVPPLYNILRSVLSQKVGIIGS